MIQRNRERVGRISVMFGQKNAFLELIEARTRKSKQGTSKEKCDHFKHFIFTLALLAILYLFYYFTYYIASICRTVKVPVRSLRNQ